MFPALPVFILGVLDICSQRLVRSLVITVIFSSKQSPILMTLTKGHYTFSLFKICHPGERFMIIAFEATLTFRFVKLLEFCFESLKTDGFTWTIKWIKCLCVFQVRPPIICGWPSRAPYYSQSSTSAGMMSLPRLKCFLPCPFQYSSKYLISSNSLQ